MPQRFHGFQYFVVMLDLEDLNFSHMELIFHLNSMPSLYMLANNWFHSTCHIQVAVWIHCWKIQTLHKGCFLRVCENIFWKINDKFLRNWSWCRQDSILLITEQGELMYMKLFLIIKDISEWTFHSGEDMLLVRIIHRWLAKILQLLIFWTWGALLYESVS